MPRCVEQNAVLDASARCCNSGKRDACGVCDGSALVVDVQNTCCASGVLDAAGYCCVSGALDECGVCDSDSQSCALSAVVNVQVLSMCKNFKDRQEGGSLGSQG